MRRVLSKFWDKILDKFAELLVGGIVGIITLVFLTYLQTKELVNDVKDIKSNYATRQEMQRNDDVLKQALQDHTGKNIVFYFPSTNDSMLCVNPKLDSTSYHALLFIHK